MDDLAFAQENLKYLAARAKIDMGMNEKKAYELLKKDFIKAQVNPRAAKALKGILKRDFQIGN